MHIQKTLTSLEETLYDFVVSIIQIPLTFYKVVVNPFWFLYHVKGQDTDKLDRKFEKYSNPVLVWFVVGVLPYYFIINTYFHGFSDGKVYEAYKGIGALNIISGISVFLVSIPLTCAFVLQLFKYKGFSKTQFRRYFNIQLYITAPFQLFYFNIFFMDMFSDFWVIVLGLFCFGILIWFLVVEFIIIKKELNCNFDLNLIVFISMYLANFIFSGICLIIFFLLNIQHISSLVNAWFADMGL